MKTIKLFAAVALVALSPLITIQIMGLIFKIKESRLRKEVSSQIPIPVGDTAGDMEIIEL